MIKQRTCVQLKDRKKTISVQGAEISILSMHEEDFISLTDMAKKFGGEDLLYNWMRNRNTVEFLGIWEQLHNPNFKGVEFDTFKKQAGLNSFRLTPKKWIEHTQAIGFQSRAGKYGGGTYANKDIAFEFGSWLSTEFKLYLIKEFQRLKEDENRRLSLDWNLNRTLSKLNYRIHTDAIKKHIIPAKISSKQTNLVYANLLAPHRMKIQPTTNRHREAAKRPWRSIFFKWKVSMDCHGSAAQTLAMTVRRLVIFTVTTARGCK